MLQHVPVAVEQELIRLRSGTVKLKKTFKEAYNLMTIVGLGDRQMGRFFPIDSHDRIETYIRVVTPKRDLLFMRLNREKTL